MKNYIFDKMSKELYLFSFPPGVSVITLCQTTRFSRKNVTAVSYTSNLCYMSSHS